MYDDHAYIDAAPMYDSIDGQEFFTDWNQQLERVLNRFSERKKTLEKLCKSSPYPVIPEILNNEKESNKAKFCSASKGGSGLWKKLFQTYYNGKKSISVLVRCL